MTMWKEDGDWYREDDDGNELEVNILEEWTICSDCKGDGKVLCDGMRGHAYSMEEFYEEFDEDERHGYFNGRYDVGCRECSGSGKVKQVNWEKLAIEDPELVAEIEAYYKNEADFASECEAERRMGC